MNEAITHLCAGLYFQMPIILKASPASYYFGQMDVIFWVHTDPGPFWTLKDRKGLCTGGNSSGEWGGVVFKLNLPSHSITPNSPNNFKK